jgi:hypothetical protein
MNKLVKDYVLSDEIYCLPFETVMNNTDWEKFETEEFEQDYYENINNEIVSDINSPYSRIRMPDLLKHNELQVPENVYKIVKNRILPFTKKIK